MVGPLSEDKTSGSGFFVGVPMITNITKRERRFEMRIVLSTIICVLFLVVVIMCVFLEKPKKKVKEN